MNEQKIHELLKKYFDGATSLAEERELQRFFAKAEIPDSLKAFRPMFMFFAEEKAVVPPTEQKSRIIRLPWIIVTGIAASVVVLFLIGLPKPTQAEFIYYADGRRIYDKEAAVESAENKLQLLAASMQKAKAGMSAFETVRESNQSLNKFNKLQEAYRQAEERLSGIIIDDF